MRQSPKKSTVTSASEKDNEAGDLKVGHNDIAAVANHGSNSYDSAEDGKAKPKSAIAAQMLAKPPQLKLKIPFDGSK
jgi:hypothetical protein